MPDRNLTVDDISGCMALSRAAGWNQVPDDWRLVLDVGRARGAVADGRLVASAAVMPYGAFGWICMVLVVPDARRRGHATRLMGWAMEALESKDMVAGLDATTEGREVYRRHGFRDLASLTRWISVEARSQVEGMAPKRIRRMTDIDFEFVARFDAEVFGGDRRRVLAALRSRCPELALVSEGAEGIDGFGFGRDGDLATHVGPVIARSGNVARTLIEAAALRIPGPVIIDLADRHLEIARLLEALGFVAPRSFTRMVKSQQAFAVDEAIFAVAGPELG